MRLKGYWEYDAIQFPRLLSEIYNGMLPELSEYQIDRLRGMTGLRLSEIGKIFEKASRVVDALVKKMSSKKRWFDPAAIRLDPAFARLLTGIYQAGLAPDQWRGLQEHLDLSHDRLKELFLRAADAYMRELET